MCAIELVSDRAGKTVASKEVGLAVQQTAYEAGAMLRVSGNIVIFSPPLVIDSGDVATVLKATEAGLAVA